MEITQALFIILSLLFIAVLAKLIADTFHLPYALVFSPPPNLAYYNTIQGIVYGVVLFSLFIQAPTLKIVCYWASGRNRI